jgi:CRP/FNR family transcriptional regulator, cyclic AMP receptor protein
MTPKARVLPATHSFAMTAGFEARHVRRGQLIIKAGDLPHSLYYIKRGSVAVYLENSTGKEIIVALLGVGEFFGELGFFDPAAIRSASCRARVDCELLEITYPRLQEYLAGTPELMQLLGKQMATRLRVTSHKLGYLTLSDATARVLQTLLELCQQADAMTHPAGWQIKISRNELGRLSNCSREMAGKVLRKLQDQNRLEVKGHTVIVYRCY